MKTIFSEKTKKAGIVAAALLIIGLLYPQITQDKLSSILWDGEDIELVIWRAVGSVFFICSGLFYNRFIKLASGKGHKRAIVAVLFYFLGEAVISFGFLRGLKEYGLLGRLVLEKYNMESIGTIAGIEAAISAVCIAVMIFKDLSALYNSLKNADCFEKKEWNLIEKTEVKAAAEKTEPIVIKAVLKEEEELSKPSEIEAPTSRIKSTMRMAKADDCTEEESDRLSPPGDL